MNGRKARAIRKQAYGDQHHKSTRKVQMTEKGLKADERRTNCQKMKKGKAVRIEV